MSAVTLVEPVAFTPTLRAEDELANQWLRQVTLRLRREVAWIWRERGVRPPELPGELPPFGSRAQEALDLTRFEADKALFFETDETAAYLSGLIAEAPARGAGAPERGSFAWLADEASLDDRSLFVLALSLVGSLDGAAGHVVAACLNDPGRTRPTLALAQRLWAPSENLFALADPAHPLFRLGLVEPLDAPTDRAPTVDWEAPLVTPAAVATRLLFPGAPLPEGLRPLGTSPGPELDPESRAVLDRLASRGPGLAVVPVEGPRRASRVGVVATAAELRGRPVATPSDLGPGAASPGYLRSLGTVCWLLGVDLYLDAVDAGGADAERRAWLERALPDPSVDVVVYLGVDDRGRAPTPSARHTLPALRAPATGFTERLGTWRRELGSGTASDDDLAEVSRRFRFEPDTIADVAAGLRTRPGPVGLDDLVAACRAELSPELGTLAQEVTPRFRDERLVLPKTQAAQFEELRGAMRSLTRVHYEWGTADAWNEGGVTALFAGPPGTGKTMAAEILARDLDLPMYRIDLSQVVNKYIGETEKNLKRVFDAADVSDTLLFFDEADALFGRRTEVRDAHDRYANLEISYLLERMERFKGLAILATNRRRDLDEAFLRRLRFIIDFPLPEPPERRAIWVQSVPEGVDASEVDFDFLAQRFGLAGGHIRSIVFNACLQSAAHGGDPSDRRLGMPALVLAVKREFEKLDRSVSTGLFGPWASIVAEVDGHASD